MAKHIFNTAAIIATATAAPAYAIAIATPAPRAPAPAAAAAQAPTRAALLRNSEAAFKAIDTNGDGVLSQTELAAAEAKGIQQRVALARQRMQAEFTKLDTNHDGQLSKAEFLAAAPQAPMAAPDVSPDFAQFDTNKDGKVTLQEYQSVMLARFDATDKQHKGAITDPSGATVTRADFTGKLTATFKLIDAGNHGSFTKADLQAFELKLRQQRAAAVRSRFEAEFNKFDINHDGQLSNAEFMAAAPTGPATAPNGSELLARMDKNHDGKVTLDEYRAPLLARFDAIDTNHDGVLSPAELQAAQAAARAAQRK